ncbi:polyprenol monophosphomannose synthase [Engelhardtia mirabilis]|uniref:Undecaprenyl-phosphate mannosyltransferase n=1 Tax=Engelhardtia mirabilis TaxID=2528011 RepID=A0A518BM08_9BACT|nr:Undecaprenyl-phosphate mannosyltransferase [Planctomycetes bacterium Pla133]QDV02345.1 Undecaprenyl-phosphate mannosyltransferase [Planctomycetes bacterium Pla86]
MPPTSDGAAPKVVCTVPTYNEAENILDLSRELLALGPEFEVLVIDDDSPDGTWKLVAEAAKTEPRLHLLHRTVDRGRGAAGRDGFVRALEMGADVVVEMDADFSHHPRFVPAMLARLNTVDARSGAELGLVLGSRGVSGGSDADRGALRQVITKAANLYIRLLLGVPVADCNSGFRCWRASTLRAIEVEKTFSPGPAIVQELLFKTARAGIGIAEIPIEFVDRVRGESTLTMRILLQGYTTVLKLRWMALTGRL